MPIIQAALGLISVLVDPKDKKKRWILVLLIIFLVTSAIITILINRKETVKREAQLKTADKNYTELKADNRRLEGYVLTMLKGFGFTKPEASQEEIVQSIEAEKNLRNLGATLATRPGAITVEYFQKDVDAEIVASELQKLGFRFKAKPPANDLPTNAIWVGNNVSINDARKVALTLIRAGVKLRSIARFYHGAGPKSLLIQVGADPAIIERPALSVSDLMSLKELKRYPS